jgi:hypothetical protein
MFESHLGSLKYNGDVHATLASLPAGDQPLVLLPKYNSQRVNEGLALAAKHFKWDTTMKWTSHSLRFGSICDAWEEASNALETDGLPVDHLTNCILDRVQLRSGHLDKKMAFWYALSAQQRADRRDSIRRVIQGRLIRDAEAEKRRVERDLRARNRAPPRIAGQRRQRDM